jgi:putative dehydrogenase
LIPASGAIGADVVGVVGLGIMGGAIARHLTAAGVTVGGHDPDAFACASAEAAGVAIASTFEELALRSRVLISSLPSASAAIDLAARLAATDVSRRTLIEMSTLALEDKLSVAEILRPSGHDLIDCPISGTGAQMAVKDVALYASGPNSVVKRCTPLLALFSREQFNLGAFGAGTRMKLIANLLVAIHNVAAAEAMGLGEAAGLDSAVMIAAIRAGAANSRIFELRAPMMADHRFVPATMKLSVWAKDMSAITVFAAELDRPTPLFDAAAPIYAAALARGLGDQDTAAVALAMVRPDALHAPAQSTLPRSPVAQA